MDTNPRQFERNNTKNDSSIVSNREETGRDDDDPLSIKDASSIAIGIVIATMTVFLPIISVLLERPTLQNNEVITNQMVNKDGY